MLEILQLYNKNFSASICLIREKLEPKITKIVPAQFWCGSSYFRKSGTVRFIRKMERPRYDSKSVQVAPNPHNYCRFVVVSEISRFGFIVGEFCLQTLSRLSAYYVVYA